VEVITNPKQVPSHDWFKLVHTASARNRIRRWLNQAGFEHSLKLGAEILERTLKGKRLAMPNNEALQECAEKLDQKSVDAMLAAVGSGAMAVKNIINLIEPIPEKTTPVGLVGRVIDRIRGSKGIRVQGMDNMMFRFAGCCQPVPGEDIVGFITRGRGVTIHHASCKMAVDLVNRSPERKIDASWDAGPNQSFIVQLEVVVENRRGMLRDITQAIADSNTDVRGAEVFAGDTSAQGKFLIEVSNLSHLNRIIEKVRRVKGVIEAHRSRRYDPSQ
jgi:GTP pyrophosphokinase